MSQTDKEKRIELRRCGWDRDEDGLWSWVRNPEHQNEPWLHPMAADQKQSLDKAYAHMRFIVDTCFIPIIPESRTRYECVWDAIYDDPDESDEARRLSKIRMDKEIEDAKK